MFLSPQFLLKIMKNQLKVNRKNWLENPLAVQSHFIPKQPANFINFK